MYILCYHHCTRGRAFSSARRRPATGTTRGSAASAPAAAADDPLADALSELETEAAPAATFEPLADMTADTTGAVSDDPQFDIDDITAVPAAESTAIPITTPQIWRV